MPVSFESDVVPKGGVVFDEDQPPTRGVVFEPERTILDMPKEEAQAKLAQLPPFARGAAKMAGAVGLGIELTPAITGQILGSPGGPAGMAAGGAAGGTVGNAARQVFEKVIGTRKEFSPGELTAATATNAIPLGPMKGVRPLVAVGRRAVQGAGLGMLGEATKEVIDEGTVTPGRVLGGAAGGAVVGGGLQTIAPAVERATPAIINAINRGLNKVHAPTMGEIGTAVGQFFSPRGALGKDIRTILDEGDAAVRALNYTAHSIQKDAERGILSIPDAVHRAAARTQFQQVLEGAMPPQALPPQLVKPALEARGMIDDLSNRAIAEGAVSGEMTNTFMDNLGTYLRRSYQVFTDPRYVPEPQVYNDAVAYIKRAWDRGRVLSDDEARGVANQLIDRTNSGLESFYAGSGKVAGKDLTVLIQREDLAPEIRALLGEIKDPIQNIGQTIPRMARLVEMNATQKRIRDTGLQNGLLSPTQTETHYVPLVSEGNERHANFQGLYTTPEVAQAFGAVAKSGQLEGVHGLVWKGFTSLNAISKTGKTIVNPDSYAPNLWGGVTTLLANGNFRFDTAKQALTLGLEDLGALRAANVLPATRDAARDLSAELTRLGVRNDNFAAGDLMNTVQGSGLWPVIQKIGEATKLNKAVSIPFQVYGGTDDFTKTIGFFSEKAKYKAAFPTLSDEALNRKAAEVVMDTMPTFSKVPQRWREASQLGLSPSFIPYTLEVFRNTYNSARIGADDLKVGLATGNKSLAVIGAKRLAALTTAMAAASGYGVSKWSAEQNGVTERQEKAVRVLGPDFNNNGVFLFNSPVEKDGAVSYSNISYLFPHALVSQAMNAGIRNEDPAVAFRDALVDQFVGGGVLTDPLYTMVRGTDLHGRQQINPETPDPIKDRAAYFYDKALEPMFVKKLERYIAAKREERGAAGQIFTTAEENKRLLGVRQTTQNLHQSMQFKLREVGRRWEDANELYHKAQRQGKSDQELAGAYKQSEEARKKLFAYGREVIGLAPDIHVSDAQLHDYLDKSGLPVRDRLALLDGEYIPQVPAKTEKTADVVARVLALPRNEQMRGLLDEALKRPSVVNALAATVKDRLTGITPREKLMRSLSSADGEKADYLLRELSKLPKERHVEQLTDWQRKGVLDATTLRDILKLEDAP